jgi:hypothetical protein
MAVSKRLRFEVLRRDGFAEAMKEAAAIKATERKKIDAYARRFKRVWEKWSMDEGRGEPFPLPDGWRDSAEQFRTAGLEPKEVERLIEVAMTKECISDRWRYFCGCCWRVVRERQEMARALIETDGDAG